MGAHLLFSRELSYLLVVSGYIKPHLVHVDRVEASLERLAIAVHLVQDEVHRVRVIWR